LAKTNTGKKAGNIVKVPLLDLQEQYKAIKEEILSEIHDVFQSQHFILGPKVEQLEKSVSQYCGCNYGVGVSSGTDALLISLMTAGVGYGDLVITSPYTFFATAGAIARVGARPVFVDIDRDTYNMDPAQLAEVVSRLSHEEKARVKAVIPVHLFGQCADMEPVTRIAERLGAVVIEDAAQAIGSEYAFKDGSVKRAGSMGQYGCFSFFPSKNLGAFGDGGMVTTNDQEVYERLKVMRAHGSKPKYYHEWVGGNFRLDAVQAAVLNVKLKYLDQWTAGRMENAGLYREIFMGAGVEQIILPEEREKRHIYNQFIIRVPRRDELRKYLNDNGVGCEVYYPVPLHMQKCFASLGYGPADFPVSVEAAETTLALPIYPELTEEQIRYVAERTVQFLARP
jgi:dTDP-4-amino-4,6-dideoxygalactose transaminase